MALFFSETVRELVQRILSRLGVREYLRDLWDRKLPKYLLLLAVLAVSLPGGLLGAGVPGHNAGDPVLTSSYPRVNGTRPALLALHAAMILGLFGLMGAYAAGSCRRVRTSAYILALVVGVSTYIAVLVHWQGG